MYRVNNKIKGLITRAGLGHYYHLAWWQVENRRHPISIPQAYRRHNALFIHVPKAAGMSVHRTFGYEPMGDPHVPAQTFRSIFPAYFRAATVFAVVRNPFDRLVSAFHYLKQRPLSADDARWAAEKLSNVETMGDFLSAFHDPRFRGEVMAWRHFAPQYTFVSDWQGNIIVDRLIRFENLESEIADLALDFGLDRDIARDNRSKRKDYLSYYTDADRAVVAQAYRRDLNLFDYADGAEKMAA